MKIKPIYKLGTIMRTITLILLIIANISLFSQENDKAVIVTDTNLYDSNFIKYWGYLKNHGVLITNDSIIVAGDREDAIIIPTDLPLKQDVSRPKIGLHKKV